MKRVILKRLETGPEGTFGLFVVSDFAFHTAELPWHGNAPYISCIPTGIYVVKWTYSPKYKRKMYLVTDVSGRSGIRIHSANWAGDRSLKLRSQVLGCIALGLRKGIIYGQKAVSQSRAAIQQFEDHMKGEPFELVILPE